MLRWLLLIPFALLVAMGAGFFALLVAVFVSPDIAMMVGGGVWRLFDAVMGLVENDIDPEPALVATLSLITRLALAVLVVPVLVTALASELLRLRSLPAQAVLTGLLSALLPLALLGLSRAPSGGELRVIGGFFLVGAVTGFVYWLVAGREAGGVAQDDTQRP